MHATLAAVALFAISALSAQNLTENVPEPPSRTLAPVANQSAMVKERYARFTVLTPELIRMEWAEDNQFEDHPSLIFLNRNLPVPPFSMTQKGGTLTIHTGKLQLVYS
ncbi:MULTISPECIES: alpha-glucosidase domain-containing protein [Acidobacteriaceae]|uniref:alpha-glucosidase domain-containing protein n=1 Tax=Acidobacteriaceae TaxID=204434 RepID=UPI00131AC23E|nr:MULTISPECIES: alpha-glucosidase domain-containing protein [Acidobacteriaceae]MDW5267425.1 alpha-glucosidase domain-containing protein [Edaphobacter sp.]